MSTGSDPSDPDPAAAFQLLGDETRVAIVSTLTERRRDAPENPTLSFSELRHQVGAADSGRFNYHLNKLKGRFVEQTENGYTLTYPGEQMAAAIVSGAYSTGVRFDPLELGHDCPFCAAPVTAKFEDGYVFVACENDHQLFSNGIPPGAAEGRSMETVLSIAVRKTFGAILLATDGVCPSCYGTMSVNLRELDMGEIWDEEVLSETLEEETLWQFVATCEGCGEQFNTPAGGIVLMHPAVVSFFWEHELDLTEEYPWLFEFIGDPRTTALVSEAPFRLRVDVELDGDHCRLTIDGEGQVVDVNLD
ncbi:MAG: hypothetical protein ACI8VE_002050 [Natrialbaceae archaeon]|jgi:hypothetical protein